MSEKKKCLVEGCEREAFSRGLCRACAAAARRAVKRNGTTWEWLEKNGLAAPATSRGSAPGPFSQAFRVAIAGPAVPVIAAPNAFGPPAAATEGKVAVPQTPQNTGPAPSPTCNSVPATDEAGRLQWNDRADGRQSDSMAPRPLATPPAGSIIPLTANGLTPEPVKPWKR